MIDDLSYADLQAEETYLDALIHGAPDVCPECSGRGWVTLDESDPDAVVRRMVQVPCECNPRPQRHQRPWSYRDADREAVWSSVAAAYIAEREDPEVAW